MRAKITKQCEHSRDVTVGQYSTQWHSQGLTSAASSSGWASTLSRAVRIGGGLASNATVQSFCHKGKRMVSNGTALSYCFQHDRESAIGVGASAAQEQTHISHSSFASFFLELQSTCCATAALTMCLLTCGSTGKVSRLNQPRNLCFGSACSPACQGGSYK
jgi:hypothetical protein